LIKELNFLRFLVLQAKVFASSEEYSNQPKEKNSFVCTNEMNII